MSLTRPASTSRGFSAGSLADPAAETPPITIWLLGITCLVIGIGMGWAIGWQEIVRHHPWWLEPGDSWGLIRGAHWIDWGAFSYIYSAPRTTIVTLPGFEILMAPVVALSGALHLAETAPGFAPILKPDSWLLYGPFFLATTVVPLFACDALARTLGLSLARRRFLALAVGAALWQVTALWGHPEDVLALGLTVFAFNAALRGNWTAAGWLLGGGLAMQLYVLALIPIFVGLAGKTRAVSLLALAAVIPGAIFLAVAIPDPRATFHVLFQQRAFPGLLHPTPWISLAPTLPGHTVAGGPVRIIGLVLAGMAGLVASRWRTQPLRLLWLVSLVLTLRYLFDAVDIPYYVSPAIVVALVLALCLGKIRPVLATAIGAFLIYFAYSHVGEWPYLFLLLVPSVALLGVSCPTSAFKQIARHFVMAKTTTLSLASPE